MRLHHVQVSMPPGQEAAARKFYADALGLVEVPKPAALAGRGGCWFRSVRGEQITAEIHLGVEDPFVPARRAHPALLVEDVETLEQLGRSVEQRGFDVRWGERHTFEGHERFHSFDAFGNRVEVLAPSTLPG